MGLKNEKQKEQRETDAAKEQTKRTDQPTSKLEKFDLLKDYGEYFVLHVLNHERNNLAPIAAYTTTNGDVNGYIYFNTDSSYNLSADAVIENMRNEFDSRINASKITSYTIFSHGHQTEKDKINHNVNYIQMECKTSEEEQAIIKMPYRFENNEIIYKGIDGLSQEQMTILFNTTMTKEIGIEYFQEQVEIEPPIYTNEAGLLVKQVNNGNFDDTWGAVIGFNTLRNNRQVEMGTKFVNCISLDPIEQTERFERRILSVDELQLELVNAGSTQLFFPSLKTSNTFQTQTKKINEWENFDAKVAVISSSGKDTFVLTYLALDYYKYTEKYHSRSLLNINLGGFGYVLDKYEDNSTLISPPFSKDFCTYMPHKELEQFACFHFISDIQSIKEIKSEDGEIDGYLLKLKMINQPDDDNFFNIDAFFHKENVRIHAIEVGMKVTGLVQLMGTINYSN